MKRNDTSDALLSALSITADAVAIYSGLMLATWLRFSARIIPIINEPQPDFYKVYAIGAAFATVITILVFRNLGLYIRPQTGSFIDKIPRIGKGCLLGTLINFTLAFAVIHIADFSRIVIISSIITVGIIVALERYALYRLEWNMARHSKTRNNILILGTDASAAHLTTTLQKETMLKANIVGFMQTDITTPDPKIPADKIIGNIGTLSEFLEHTSVNQIILTNSSLGHEKIVEIILLCEQNLITFNMILDLFRVLTSSMDVQSLNDIPLLGISRWPLDYFWKRILKRGEDIIGAAVALLLSAPIIVIAAIMIKKSSPGPIFYKQERCGENGKNFNLYKLRTMQIDAEQDSGPVFTAQNDPRTTKIGALLRRTNMDELPQLWNVLKGEMSMAGPRPERPHFVEKFKTDINKYMWRHVSKPGMTGWAQVNGLRGNTSIEERIKYDLYYLENWSLTFDFKILVRTLFANKNAY
ncbi:MAG: undecaprenyl-phosphate glucose phosphotransferase [Kiritimatiellae bacterium]|nr:undecaprenyl-phosphate glucose phosphotransferase [Kiritimatiellia bacterium]